MPHPPPMGDYAVVSGELLTCREHLAAGAPMSVVRAAWSRHYQRLKRNRRRLERQLGGNRDICCISLTTLATGRISPRGEEQERRASSE